MKRASAGNTRTGVARLEDFPNVGASVAGEPKHQQQKEPKGPQRQQETAVDPARAAVTADVALHAVSLGARGCPCPLESRAWCCPWSQSDWAKQA
jgi:hypothetical protein